MNVHHSLFMANVFDRAWELVKKDEDTRLQNALNMARMRPKKKKPLNLTDEGYVRSGSKDDKMGC
tara:strand:- start:203 stop:397 length:195 start_codon:yes stop_codon:yes gene_type:complete